jgi:hypothetical protein
MRDHDGHSDGLLPSDLTELPDSFLREWADDSYFSLPTRMRLADELEKRIWKQLRAGATLRRTLRNRTGGYVLAAERQPPPQSPAVLPDPDAEDPAEGEEWDREATREVRWQDREDTPGEGM